MLEHFEFDFNDEIQCQLAHGLEIVLWKYVALKLGNTIISEPSSGE